MYLRVRSQNCENGCYLRHVCLSVPMEKLGSHWTDFHEFLYLTIYRKCVDEVQVTLKSNKIIVTLHECRYTFMIIARSVLLRMRNSSRKRCRENQNTQFIFNIFFFTKFVPFMK